MTNPTTPKEAAMTEAGDLLPCPKCGVGKPVHKHNLSPASWLECDHCGFKIGPWIETWNEISALRNTRAPITPSVDKLVERAWKALKERCCSDAEKAVRCVMVEEGQFRAALEAASSTPLVAPSDRSQRAVVEAVARIIHPTAFQLRDELRRTAPIEEYSGDHFPHREEATRQADEQCAVAYDKARAALAALQPPAADNATGTEDGLADEKYRLMLLDLLAIIHRDGGHKTQEIGIKLAWEQAMQLSSERIAALRTTGQPAIAAADNGALEKAKEAIRRIIEHTTDETIARHFARQALAALEAKPVGEADV